MLVEIQHLILMEQQAVVEQEVLEAVLHLLHQVVMVETD
jgi:hypothetical protein